MEVKVESLPDQHVAKMESQVDTVASLDDFEMLSFRQRMMVAVEVARGLAYLHQDDVKVLHRDFKSSNILMDWGWNIKIFDFGLAKDGPPYGHLMTKSDVYSFGVILLELLSGRRAIDTSRPKEEQNLVEWAMQNFYISLDFLSDFMDKRLDCQYSRKKALMVVEIAKRCVSEHLNWRPNMTEVVFAFEVVYLFDKWSSPGV